MTRATPNRLARETSPYLLQHSSNPVDWYPWGQEALERARTEDKPIFLSIGYSACHWCHVMERECFENDEIAALMNEHFVNIKVDREERPDIDEIYMKAVVAMTGSGGWPMSVFLTPDQKPFFGATYLPPTRMHNRRSFPEIMLGLVDVWANHRDGVLQQASKLTQHILDEAAVDLRSTLDADVLERSKTELLQMFDATWGGFGRAPKFPHALDIRICLRHHLRTGDSAALNAAVHTLDRMARGGVYDQLGGGFHRYSTDAQWRIPHFEKMLYDNALLVPAYLEAHLVTGNTRFAEVAAECCEWVLREMVTPHGGFASAQDADSEGEEGKFFVWTRSELSSVLGEAHARIVAAGYDVTDEGNFEHGKSALWLPRALAEVAAELGVPVETVEQELRAARELLLGARESRIKPMTDDKVLVAWNGLMISALAHAYQVLDAPQYLDAARAAARYVLTAMQKPDGSLLSTARAGHAHLDACLDDYAFMTQALIDLYESDFDVGWLEHARALCTQIETRFWDHALGGYFTTGAGHETLIARTKNAHDGALPAGGAVQALNLARLAELFEDSTLHAASRRAIDGYAKLANSHPRLFSQLLCAVDFHAGKPRQVVIAGTPESLDTQALLASVRRTFDPARVIALAARETDVAFLPLLEGRVQAHAAPARAYVCQDRTCLAPVTTPSALRALLEPRTR